MELDVLAFNWPPPPDQRDREPNRALIGSPHQEGFNPPSNGGVRCRWFIGITLYLDDVEEGGGASFVWPRSHLAIHRYFKKVRANHCRSAVSS